jgi:hypothetical protein
MPGVGGALELDRGIRREDIQVLSSRDQVAAGCVFERLQEML